MKKKILGITGILLCLLGGCSSSPTSYETGKENLEQQNYTQAIESFQNAVEEDDHTAESWRGIGVAWTEQGVYDKAQEAFETALGLAGESGRALRKDLYLYLADAQYHQGDYQSCVDTCDSLLKIGKENDGYFLRGSAYLHLKEYNRADSDFAKVISGSKNYEDYLDVYMVYRNCGLNADGSAYLEEGLKIEADNGEDYYNKGRIYYYLEDYENARKALETSADKGYAMARIYLGKVYLAMGENEKARETYDQCMKEKDRTAEAYNGLAYCSASEEDYETALSYIQEGLDQAAQEEQQSLLFNQIIIYEKMTDYDSAREKLSEYLELYPADENAIRENYFLETR